jgi:nucleotidyltransferase substrate binding protein (TIGR01987 family)
MDQDIRWILRFSNLSKAYLRLEKYLEEKDLNELEKQGLIKAFEYTFELSWKTLQDFLLENGYRDIKGPKPVIQQSFQDGYITDGKGWLKMIEGRNLTSHTYDEETAESIILAIRASYAGLFKDLVQKLEKFKSSQQGELF